MTKEQFKSLVGKNIVVDYDFNGEIQKWDMSNFYFDENGEIKHKFRALIMDVVIRNAIYPFPEDEVDCDICKHSYWLGDRICCDLDDCVPLVDVDLL